MSRKKPQPAALPFPSSENFWTVATGLLACVLVFLVPFLPDEKLVRLKLEALELGILGMAALVGTRIICTRGRIGVAGRTLFSAVLAWMVVNVGLWVIAPEKSLASVELRRVILAAAAFFSFALSDLTRAWQKRFLLSWSFSGGLLALYGLLQVSGGIGLLAIPQMTRVMGTYGNPIFFAAFLLITIFVSCASFTLSQTSFTRILLVLALFAQLGALYCTQTRAALVALVIAAGVGLITTFGVKKIPAWLVGLVVFGAGLFIYQTRNMWERDQGHLLIWRDTLRMWKDHPIQGVGLGAFHTNFPAYAQDDLKHKWPQGQFIVNYAHNEYLQTLAEGGVLALISFLAVPFLFFKRVKNENTTVQWLSLGVLAIFIQNFFSVDMRFSISLATCFLLMGFTVALAAPTQKNKLGESAPMSKARYVLAFCYLAGLAALFPHVLKPYRAQQEVSAAPNFFDQRLLDPAKTIDDLERLAAEYPKEPSVLEKLAYVYAKEMKTSDGKINPTRADQAASAYQRLIQADPSRFSAHNNLANVFYTTGHVGEAMAAWKEAVAVKPDFVDAHLNMGKIFYTQGKLKEAADQFETVLKYDPKNAEAIVYLKRMVE